MRQNGQLIHTEKHEISSDVSVRNAHLQLFHVWISKQSRILVNVINEKEQLEGRDHLAEEHNSIICTLIIQLLRCAIFTTFSVDGNASNTAVLL